MLTVQIVIVVALIVVNGLLAMSEMAIVSSRPARLRSMADRGIRGARMAMALANAPGRFLSTVQIGITLVGVLAGAFSGATIATPFAAWLASFGLSGDVADNVALGLVVAAITYASLIVGELVPKQIALRAPERVASTIAAPMTWLARFATPIVVLLDVSSAAVLRLLGSRRGERQRVTDEEIRALIAEAEASGVVQAGERRMISGVMRMADRNVRAIMTPLPEIEWIDLAADEAVILDSIRQSDRSRLLACEGNPDNVVGVLRVRDVLQARLEGRPTPIREMVRKPLILPDSLAALHALDRMHAEGSEFGLVVDEYGHVEGIVTPADALAAIRGASAEMSEDDEPLVVKRSDGSFLVSGAAPLHVLEDTLGMPLPAEHPYHTVAGLLLYRMRRLPVVGQSMVLAGWRFEVVDMDGRRIDKVLVSRAS